MDQFDFSLGLFAQSFSDLIPSKDRPFKLDLVALKNKIFMKGAWEFSASEDGRSIIMEAKHADVQYSIEIKEGWLSYRIEKDGKEPIQSKVEVIMSSFGWNLLRYLEWVGRMKTSEAEIDKIYRAKIFLGLYRYQPS